MTSFMSTFWLADPTFEFSGSGVEVSAPPPLPATRGWMGEGESQISECIEEDSPFCPTSAMFSTMIGIRVQVAGFVFIVQGLSACSASTTCTGVLAS